MASHTVVVKVTLLMIRVWGAVEILHMAAVTVCRSARIMIVRVALGAIQPNMRPRQLITDYCMVKLTRSPSVIRMTSCAVVVKIALLVIRVKGIVEVQLVAGIAVCWRSVEPTVNVTIGTDDGPVRAG